MSVFTVDVFKNEHSLGWICRRWSELPAPIKQM
jgi:hypothetical protein